MEAADAKGRYLVDSEAEQVQKCSAAAQGIFSRAERLCGYDCERVLAMFSDRDQHFALGKIGRRVHTLINLIEVRMNSRHCFATLFIASFSSVISPAQSEGTGTPGYILVWLDSSTLSSSALSLDANKNRVRPICTRRAISDLLRPARCSFRISAVCVGRTCVHSWYD